MSAMVEISVKREAFNKHYVLIFQWCCFQLKSQYCVQTTILNFATQKLPIGY